jgi:hypothetical protein
MVHSARYHFLSVLEEECPEAREELVGTVRTVYKEMFDIGEARAGGAPIARKALNRPDLYENKGFMDWLARTGPDFENAVDPFSLALKSWIERFNLRSEWLADAGIRTIWALEAGLDWEDRLPWEVRSWKMLLELTTADELEFQFSHQFKFGPSVFTYEAMKEKIRKEFKTAVNDWFQNLDGIMKQHGYEENPTWDDPERDIRWLVRFQCNCEEYADIAQEQKGVTADVVRHAVKKAAEILDIKRRKARRGRPSKKKST